MQAYYSVIQYIPDLGRAEAANVGVVLRGEDPFWMRVKIDRLLKRPFRFFYDHPDHQIEGWHTRLLKMVEATAERLMSSEIQRRVDLTDFIRTRANQIQLTELRSIKIDGPDDIDKLFGELVLPPTTGGEQCQ